MLELYSLLFFFFLIPEVLGQGGSGVPIWNMWTGTPREQRQLTRQGWVWPWTPGFLRPLRGQGDGSQGTSQGHWGARCLCSSSTICSFCPSSVAELQFQRDSGPVVPVFTAQAAVPGCLSLAGDCCRWAPLGDPLSLQL